MEQERKKKINDAKKQNGAKFQKTKALLLRAAKVPLRLLTEVSEAFWETVQREKGEKSLRERLEPAAFFLAVLAGSAVISLAAFPLEVYPAGFALLSSVGGGIAKKEEKSASSLSTAFYLTVFAGVLISCMFLKENGIFYLIGYMILFFSRAGITGGKLDDSVLSRVTFSAACATGLGLFLSLMKGFTVNSVFSAISMGIMTPLLTYLVCGFYIYSATEGVSPQRSHRRVYLEATALTLAYLFLYSLREAEIFGCSLSFVLAVLMMLFTARRRGALYGAAAGLIGGMACLSSLAPSLAVAGFFAGLFFEYSAGVAAMVSFVAACGYSLYAEGFQMFGMFTADYLLGLALFFPLIHFFPEEKKESPRSAEKELMHKETVKRTRRKLKEMSDAFSSLSEVFYTVGDSVKKPGLTESTRLVSESCSRVCSRCSLSALCWGEKSHGMTVNATTEVAARLLAKGAVSEADFSEPFSSHCQKLPRLVEIINQKFEELSGGSFKNNKTSLLAGEYSSVSRLLKSTAGELDRELEYNPALEGKAKKILKDMNISHRRVAVFGQRELRIDVYGIVLERVGVATAKLLEEFGKAFDCVFDAPAFLMYEESVVMRLRKKRKIRLECAKSGCTKKGESVSGDSASFFETDRDYFYTLICDGMGSGREAAFTSRLASIFIEKLMHCATPKNVTLEMLNTFLMSKTDETFTSVDLLEVDLLSGNANFIKAGAAPSFVLRGDRLHRIESRTPPAGALVRMCAEQTGFSLRDGDYVIQLSDGAEDSGEGSGWLVKLLAASSFESAADLCELIFSAAKRKGDFRDDLSISVLKVVNAK